jgi:bifunctional DNA-binding transcriptional regulator/antitoxin component of YhaV-PrlF toxin-antitoxin module
VIPVEMREELGLEEGEKLSARIEGGRLVLESRRAILKRLRREFRKGARGRDPVAELIAERRAEARREDEEDERFRRRHP